MPSGDERYGRIEKLSTEQRQEVDLLLMKGASPMDVADLIMNQWGLYQNEVKLESFAKQLQRYRRRQLDPGLERGYRRAHKRGAPELDAFNTNINVMEELGQLILTHKQRIYKLLEREKTMPVLLSDVRHEMKELVNMLKVLADLQLETGVLKRAPKQVSGMLQLMSVGEEQARLDFEQNIQTTQELRGLVDDFFDSLKPITHERTVQ